eukprot:12409197-Karenia_brevis.AAC.1
MMMMIVTTMIIIIVIIIIINILRTLKGLHWAGSVALVQPMETHCQQGFAPEVALLTPSMALYKA